MTDPTPTPVPAPAVQPMPPVHHVPWLWLIAGMMLMGALGAGAVFAWSVLSTDRERAAESGDAASSASATSAAKKNDSFNLSMNLSFSGTDLEWDEEMANDIPLDLGMMFGSSDSDDFINMTGLGMHATNGEPIALSSTFQEHFPLVLDLKPVRAIDYPDQGFPVMMAVMTSAEKRPALEKALRSGMIAKGWSEISASPNEEDMRFVRVDSEDMKWNAKIGFAPYEEGEERGMLVVVNISPEDFGF